MYPKCCYKSIVDFYSFLPFQIKQYEKKMAKLYIHGNDFELRNENQKKKLVHTLLNVNLLRENHGMQKREQSTAARTFVHFSFNLL